jgi:hypothetical protein
VERGRELFYGTDAIVNSISGGAKSQRVLRTSEDVGHLALTCKAEGDGCFS